MYFSPSDDDDSDVEQKWLRIKQNKKWKSCQQVSSDSYREENNNVGYHHEGSLHTTPQIPLKTSRIHIYRRAKMTSSKRCKAKMEPCNQVRAYLVTLLHLHQGLNFPETIPLDFSPPFLLFTSLPSWSQNTCVVTMHTFVIRNSSTRNLYSTFYPFTIEIQQVVVLIAIENKKLKNF